MKRTLVFLALLSLILGAAIAQPGPGYGRNREKIEAQKIAYITQQLALTPAEAQKFWPVYNEFDAKRDKIMQSNRERHRKLRDMEMGDLTEEAAARMADEELIEAQQLLDLRKEYHSRFKSVLPASKVLKLYRAEEEFKKVLIERLRGGKGPGAGDGPGRGPGNR
ncbi:MAG TPA: hypothetical protein P5550_00800 [Bacteroidales bacterium]|nr:hypothetical protein [Bacteroidales bacterium]HRZ77144.1 hypothetical protein [Bacteroidales bacterium]